MGSETSQSTSQEMPTQIKLKLKDTSKTLWSATLEYTGSGKAARDTDSVYEVDSSSSDQIQIVEETWDPEFQEIQEEAQSASAKRSVQDALAVTKFAWDILKDSRPVTQAEGAFTSVLSSADSNWEHYSQANEFKSPEFTFKGENLFGMTLFKAKFKVQGAYKASYSGSVQDVPKGLYLPLVFFNFKEAYAMTTWSLKGNASASSPANIGDANNLTPLIYTGAHITASGWFQNIAKNFSFKVTGSQGYVGQA